MNKSKEHPVEQTQTVEQVDSRPRLESVFARPTVGRIVHYLDPMDFVHKAAIVIAVGVNTNDEMEVNLVAFDSWNGGSNPRHGVTFDWEGNKLGT